MYKRADIHDILNGDIPRKLRTDPRESFDGLIFLFRVRYIDGSYCSQSLYIRP